MYKRQAVRELDFHDTFLAADYSHPGDNIPPLIAVAQQKKISGINSKKLYDCEWAAWANGTAVRELDFHDTFLAADYSHPGDNIPPILAVGQKLKKSGIDLLRGIITAYEVQVNLVKGICLHKHKIDHIGHLGPSVAAGIGSMLKLSLIHI